MNTVIKKPIFFGCIALGALLTSCVEPYPSGHGSGPVVTTYRPGYEVRALPSGYRTETIGGTRYYTQGGTYYQSRSGRYVVVDAPRGRNDDSRYDNNNHDRDRRNDWDRRDYNHSRGSRDVVITKLPPGYRTVKYRGSDYYQSRDVYYQRRGTGYVIVSRPY